MEIFRTAIFVLLLILCYSVQTQYEETNEYHMIQCHLYDVVIRILRRRRCAARRFRSERTCSHVRRENALKGAVLSSCNWVSSCSHRKRTVPELVWTRTETTSSAGSRFGCLACTRVRLLYSHLPKRSAPRGETN